MNCGSCGRANRAGARFCGGCGRALAPRCPACGAEGEPDAQFCDACGASFAARPAPAAEGAGARKVVSVVFADLIGSTALHERLDAESTRRLMDRYYRAMTSAVEAQGGTVMQLLGDGVMAAFGVPRVAEDDAIRAVRAAVGMQRAFRELADEQSPLVGSLGLRVAVNTGEVVVPDDQSGFIGDPVNVAARLQQEAGDGDVLVGEATRRLVGDRVTLAPFGTFALKGRSEAVAAYRVVSLDRPAGAPAIAFVGRNDELRRIAAAYDAAVAGPNPRLAVILGSPGLGKSRLIDEFARRVGDEATVLTTHCDAAGGATFAPLARSLRTLLGIDDATGGDVVRAELESALPGDEAERARIAAGIGALLAGTPASPEETFFVVRRLLAALATERPVVLAIDDLQWGEPLLLDLVEHLVQWSSGVPLLVLVAARPELRDARSSLASAGGLVADVVTLAGLDAAAATKLAASVIGADALPAAVAGRVLATSEGNPLFLGELVRMLVDDGALRREGDRWTTGVALADVEMPPTIHALLAARIERLRPEERLVLERAAIVGRHFSRAAVAHLLPREAQADLDARFEALRRSELIEPDASWFLGEPSLRFHHALIRDAAYRRVLKGTRAELHGRFADWVAARVGEAVEHDETLGWHLEQAHQHLSELGPLDEQGRALGERAARHLAAAGQRALARDDVPLAASLLGRALDRLDADHPTRAALVLDWCEALLGAGDVGAAAHAIAELGRIAGDSDRLRAWHVCFTGQLAVLTDSKTLRATADAVATAAEQLASAGDTAGEAKAHSVHALALGRLGKVGACEAALDRALAAARRAHDRRRSNAVLAGAPVAALWGPSPVTRASGRCLDVVRVLRITQGAPAVEAVALRCQAVLEALRGRIDAARRMIASSRRMVEELGITHRLLEADVFAGLIDLLDGDAPAAERCLRPAYEGLRDHGLGIDAAQAAAYLGRALLAQGRAAEAEALTEESEALAGDDLQAAIAWRGVRAEALARRGEHAAAIEFARAAVEIAAGTDALLHHANARLALATALRAAGQRDLADMEERRAIELWEAKGATLLAERARRDAGRVIQTERAPAEAPAPARPVRRRVRGNAATANAARLDAAIAARDADAFPTVLADHAEIVHHPTAAVYDQRGAISNWRSLLQAADVHFATDPLATLGDSLALCRASVSFGALVDDGVADVGAVAKDEFLLIEVDARGLRARAEFFALDRLGDAVARLYERHADLLLDGPERTRAAVTARSVATMLGPLDLDRYRTALAPAVEFDDHRPLGMGQSRGVETFMRALRSLLEVAAGVALHDDDVLELRPDLLLVRRTTAGTDRAGGGAFERQFLNLWVFGADGLLSRLEWFPVEHEAEALARVDALTSQRRARRVRPNAATEHASRLDAAAAARDFEAFQSLLADGAQGVHHPTGTTYEEQRALPAYRALLQAPDLTFAHEPLATLGDSLALCATSLSFSETAEDFGAIASDSILLLEVDAAGRRRASEFFATERLSDAVARLYERYAELLPEGPTRNRAAATARSIAAVLGPYDIDRYAAAIAPSIEFADRKTFGHRSGRGAEGMVRGFRAMSELADDLGTRVDDVLAVTPGALLLRWTNFGTERAGGGPFERPMLILWVFGVDGLVTRNELFDADRDADALARFDELPSETPLATRRVRLNVATANAARLDAAIAARDLDAALDLLADDMEGVHHPTGVTYDRQGARFSFQTLLGARDLVFEHEPLATLGDTLALFRCRTSFSELVSSELAPFGAVERESLILFELDASGRQRRIEFFAADRLDDALTRLYELYAVLLPNGPGRARAAATAPGVAAMLGPADLDRWSAGFAPDLEFVDSRNVGFGSLRGAGAVVEGIRSLIELTNDFATRIDDVIGVRPDALLVRWTNLGTLRAGGGGFERDLCQLWRFGADGRLVRWEQFAADRAADALARFDELEPAVRRRVRPNTATAHAARMSAAMAAQDGDGLSSLLAEGVEFVHHPSGVTYGLEPELAALRELIRLQPLAFRFEPLATLGDSLVVCRHSLSGAGAAVGQPDVGAWEGEQIVLIQVDAQGRGRRIEFFATDRLGDAIARLYERYADLVPEGSARARAAAIARSVATNLGPFDVETIGATGAPDIQFVDHRTLGFGSTKGPRLLMQRLRSLIEVSADVATRADDVLALRPDALLLRWTNLGTERAGGGTYEHRFLMLFAFEADGLVTHNELFDLGRESQALARFDEIATRTPATRFANAAWSAVEKMERSWRERDWDAMIASFVPTLVMDDRRALVHLQVSGEEFLANQRFLFAMKSSRWHSDLLATRGERLSLGRTRFTGEDGAGGNILVEMLSLVQIDASERYVALVLFDSDALDAAYTELDARYHSGEAAPHARVAASMRAFHAVFASRDWSALAAQCAPDLVVHDHRLLGWETLHGPAAYVEALRSLVELAPDTKLRLDHVSMCERGYLVITVWEGSHEGGAYETPSLMVAELDGQGRIRRFDQYDLERLDEARARYSEVTTEQPVLRIENAATRSIAELRDAMGAGDWERVDAVFAPGYRGFDRRSMVQLELDRAGQLESMRVVAKMRAFRITREVLATRGDRLALEKVLFEGTDRSIGPSAIEYLSIVEVNDAGFRVAMVMLDPDDLDAAYAELDRRYAAGEAAACARVSAVLQAFRAALAIRDWDALALLFAPDLVLNDHRRLGWETLRGPAAYVETLRSLVDLSPDVQLCVDHITMSSSGFLFVVAWQGTREGGAFEVPKLGVFEIDTRGRIGEIDQYDLDQLDEARARFEALGADPARDPLAAFAKPNAASAAVDRVQAAFEARDWTAMRAVCTPDAKIDDRRRHTLVSLDADAWVADARRIVQDGDVHYRRRLVSTAGDRVVLERVVSTGQSGGDPFEVEYLAVTEVDERGSIAAISIFDLDEWRAAHRETWMRWLAHEPAIADSHQPLFEFIEATNDHDRARIRAVLANDLVVDDHLRTGPGRLDGVDAYLDWITGWFELAPDLQLTTLYSLASDARGGVAVLRFAGTVPGGGAFETLRIVLSIVERGLITRAELFELEDADAALARFAELRPDPLRIPPNAATRATDRFAECVEARDWDALASLFAPTLVFEDRRPLVRDSGDREKLLASVRLAASSGARASSSLLATAGDRLALSHVRFSLFDGATLVGEVDTLQITEVDAEGRIVASIAFDPADRRAASVEMSDRYLRSDPARWMPAAAVEGLRAMNDRDIDRLRAVLPDDLVVDDHRRTGLGRLEGAAAFIASLSAFFDLAPDLTIETLYHVAAGKHGDLAMARMFGTLSAGGGEVEGVYLRLSLYQGDRVVGMELFEPEDLELAKARFEELRPDPLHIPANAATRLRNRIDLAFAAGDWAALRALAGRDFVFDERRRGALVRGDVELWIKNMEVVRSSPGARFTRERIGTVGDRIALERVVLAGETADAGRFEIEFILLTECDAGGRLAVSITFDLADRRAAFAEAQARFAAGEAVAVGGQAPIAALIRALGRHDWEALCGSLAEGASICDRRALAIMGEFDRDQWTDSLRTLVELAPDMDWELFRILAWSRHGRVGAGRLFGTAREGGPFENAFVAVLMSRGDRVERYEFFDAGDADRALARFEELCAAAPG